MPILTDVFVPLWSSTPRTARPTSRPAVALLLLVAMWGELAAATIRPAAAIGVPFTCNNLAYLSTVPSNASTTTQLYSVSSATIPFVLAPVGAAASMPYNALGYNPVDNYLYAIQSSTNTLLKIDSTGAVTSIGAVTGLPAGNTNSGAFLSNGTFVVGNGTSLYFINIATPAVTSTVSLGFSIVDLAYNPIDGYLYTMYSPSANDVTVQMNTSGVIQKTIAQTTTSVTVNTGAQWFDSAGHYFFGSTNGQFYQVNLQTGDMTLLSTNVAYSQIDAAACINAPVLSAGTLTTGPVGADATTGSYDGMVAATNNNDFTALSFSPVTGSETNSGTAPGSPVGNVLGSVTPFVVPNSFTLANAPAAGSTVSFTVTAPASPSGWTAQICPSLPSPVATGTCTAQTASASSGYWSAVGAAGSTATGTYTLPTTVSSATAIVYYVRYAPPTGTTAYTRYDALITAYGGNGNSNTTHDELYSGFVPLTKTVTTQTAGSCASIPSAGACPGAVVLYAIDYRNIMVGGASESTIPGALLTTKAGSLQIGDSGTSGGNTWASISNGLNDPLVAGANGTTTYGDTTSGSTITGGTVGSTNFSDVVGGSSFQLVAPGVSGTSQGTIYFRVVVN